MGISFRTRYLYANFSHPEIGSIYAVAFVSSIHLKRRNQLSSVDVMHRPLIDTRIVLVEVFHLAFPHNSKLNPTHY